MKNLLKPPILFSGSKLRLVSPGSCLAALVPHRVERAKTYLTSKGFEVEDSIHALSRKDYVSASAEDRAADINAAFGDRSVNGILCYIGGLHYNQLLPYLDYELIAANPKPLIGYSDATVIQLALYHKIGLVSFSGPAGLTQFAEFPEPLPYTAKYFEKALMSLQPIGRIMPAEQWTDEVLDWFSREDLTRPRDLKCNIGFVVLSGGKARGRLLGGCLPSILHLRGTQFWPDFEGCILFLDIPEGHDFKRGESIDRIDMDLSDLELSGVFEKSRGVLIGRIFGCTEEETKAIYALFKEKLAKYRIPVMANLDFGHSDPIVTLPIGVEALLDADHKVFEICESGVLT